jgi:hypothetical protein
MLIKIRISALLLLVTIPCFGQKAAPAPGESQTDLAQQAADPTAPLMAFNFKLGYVPAFYRLSGFNARSVTGTPQWTIRFAFTIFAPAG